jgi:hypothetical protein
MLRECFGLMGSALFAQQAVLLQGERGHSWVEHALISACK